MNHYEDIAIVCTCGRHFIWTEGEQEFLQRLIDSGKTNANGTPISFTTPKRCEDCRAAKKRRYAQFDQKIRSGQQY
jgi:Probable zinc-ribbon domain